MDKTYPTQCWVEQTTTNTLGIDAKLYAVTDSEEDNGNPLQIHNGFSRYEISLINKTDGSTNVGVFNLSPFEIPSILKKLEIAMANNFAQSFTPVTSNETSEDLPLCHIVTFNVGKHKGKTTAAFILENGKDAILSQRDFLIQNLGKYPKNQNIIDGIDNAIELYDAGKLSNAAIPAPAPVSTNSFVIYDIHDKTKAKKDEAGRRLVCDMKIEYERGKNYPVVISITNYYAPIVVLEDKRQNIQKKDAVNHVKVSYRLTEDAAYNMFSHLEDLNKAFKNQNFAQEMTLAQKQAKENADAANANRHTSASSSAPIADEKPVTENKEVKIDPSCKVTVSSLASEKTMTVNSIGCFKEDDAGNYRLQVTQHETGSPHNVVVVPSIIKQMGTDFLDFVEACATTHASNSSSHFTMKYKEGKIGNIPVLCFLSFA